MHEPTYYCLCSGVQLKEGLHVSNYHLHDEGLHGICWQEEVEASTLQREGGGGEGRKEGGAERTKELGACVCVYVCMAHFKKGNL